MKCHSKDQREAVYRLTTSAMEVVLDDARGRRAILEERGAHSWLRWPAKLAAFVGELARRFST